jgi:hypothetical protein
MNSTPKWFLPVAILALAWNLIGCAAYLKDVTTSAADIAQMSATQRAQYAARPAWSVGATAIAVWAGALGCVGLIMRRRWATPLLAVSLAGVVVQDISLFTMSGADAQAPPAAVVLQGLVLAIAISLVLLARNSSARGWIK